MDANFRPVLRGGDRAARAGIVAEQDFVDVPMCDACYYQQQQQKNCCYYFKNVIRPKLTRSTSEQQPTTKPPKDKKKINFKITVGVTLDPEGQEISVDNDKEDCELREVVVDNGEAVLFTI
jgi:hypothetical protein